MLDRRYEPWLEKHKAPQGFGARCPPMAPGLSQLLLERAVEDRGRPNSDKLYVVYGEWCFVAHKSRAGVYHGYPVLGSDVPPRVLKQLEELGRITPRQRKRLRAQSGLPRVDPEEAPGD